MLPLLCGGILGRDVCGHVAVTGGSDMTLHSQGVPGIKGDQGEPGKRGHDGSPVSPCPPDACVPAQGAWLCAGVSTAWALSGEVGVGNEDRAASHPFSPGTARRARCSRARREAGEWGPREQPAALCCVLAAVRACHPGSVAGVGACTSRCECRCVTFMRGSCACVCVCACVRACVHVTREGQSVGTG